MSLTCPTTQDLSRATFPANLIISSAAAKACADATTWKVGLATGSVVEVVGEVVGR